MPGPRCTLYLELITKLNLSYPEFLKNISMIHKMLLLFLSLCLMSAVVNCGSPKANVLSFQETDQEIKVSVGEIFKIDLPSNIGTGYSWTLKVPLDTTLISFVDQEYIENDLMTEEEESKEIWRFQAVKKGTASIQMIYKRPWEEISQDGKETNFEVIIK